METIQLTTDDPRVGRDGALPKVDVFGNAYDVTRVSHKKLDAVHLVIIPMNREVDVQLSAAPKAKTPRQLAAKDTSDGNSN